MSSANTALWDNLGRTDPAATKGFTRGGGFKGTAIKPMWSYKRMTEEFGPCGKGWGIHSPDFTTMPGADGEILVYCTVSIWYESKDQVCWGVGGDKVISKFSSGAKSDDEAFKKAYTDAVTNALKLIGVGADVHMGMFDDSKYVNSMREEFAEEPARNDHRKPNGLPEKGWRKDGTQTSYALKNSGIWDEFKRELDECKTVLALEKFALVWSNKAEADKWNPSYREGAHHEINAHRRMLINGAPDDDTFPGDLPSGVRQELRNHPLNGG